jgi:hypothetical protein
MTKKKKAKKSIPRDYSASNTKGWITRRRNARGRKLSEMAAYLGKKRPTEVVSLEMLKAERKALQRRIAEHVAADVTEPHEEGGVMWYNAHPIEYLHKDGTIAAYPSILRHLVDVTDIEKRLDDLFDQFKANKKLPRYERRTKEAIIESIAMGAQRIADEYDVDIHEVFTLYHSG